MSSISLELQANVHAPTRARAAVRDAMAELSVAEDERWRTELIVTELVSNAVRHGPGGQVLLALEAGRRGVRGEVHDAGPGIHHDELERRRATEEGGRGLFLVDALSDSWGLEADSSGVWFEVGPHQ